MTGGVFRRARRLALTWLWPRSLRGQMLLAIAAALLIAQGVGTALVWRASVERSESSVAHSLALRIVTGSIRRENGDLNRANARRMVRQLREQGPSIRPMPLVEAETSTRTPTDTRDGAMEDRLGQILSAQGVEYEALEVFPRKVSADPAARRFLIADRPRGPADIAEAEIEAASRRPLEDRRRPDGPPGRKGPADMNDAPIPRDMVVAAVRLPGDDSWLIARAFGQPRDLSIGWPLIAQTLLTYLVLVGAVWLILTRITGPLSALTRRVERFAGDPSIAADNQLKPQGPLDTRRLIAAHNRMEARIGALLDEKDVMLGAIGHDLKTPLAALRVRIESVEDDAERNALVHTISDITNTLDDILSLARVGRPSDPLETTELSALVIGVVEEYEDMGEPVELGDTQRIVLPLRATWIRRALRNLVSNALRYAGGACVCTTRRSDARGDWAIVRVEDEGPGIPEEEIAFMLEPFQRGDPSRNRGTGGAGIGLTLARAIAEQHGGELSLTNRTDGKTGLVAEIALPLEAQAKKRKG